MKHTKTVACAALIAPALLAFATPRDAVKFSPEAATSVSKTFTSRGEFSLDDMSMLMNGQDPGMMPEMEMTMSIDQTVTVTDVYGTTSNGRPQKVTRTFDEIGQEMEFQVSVDMMGDVQDESADGSGTSELEGKTVLFAWDEDAEEFVITFADGDGDEELLQGLVEDMDLRLLLPDGDVSEGDEWDIELSRLPDILAAGGDFAIDLEMEGEAMQGGPDPEMMGNVREILSEMIEGEATARYAGNRDEDGVRVAVIEVEIDITAARDMSDLMEEMMGENIPEGVEMELEQVDLEFIFEGSGILLWNVAGGHLHSFELEGDAGINLDMGMSMDMGGQAMSMEMSMAMSGTLAQTVTVNE